MYLSFLFSRYRCKEALLLEGHSEVGKKNDHIMKRKDSTEKLASSKDNVYATYVESVFLKQY